MCVHQKKGNEILPQYLEILGDAISEVNLKCLSV